jgi:predicted component of type VI protein secretion system
MSTTTSRIVLDERTREFTVQEWWEDYVKQIESRAQTLVDEAVDDLSMAHKEEAEAIRTRKHERQLIREREAGSSIDLKAPAAKRGKKKADVAAAAAAAEASSKSVAVDPLQFWDVDLTLIASGDPEHITGKPVRLSPYERTKDTEKRSSASSSSAAAVVGSPFTMKMCRIGRSNSLPFQAPSGLSLYFDSSVSLWHGKITCLQGKVFYTDLESSNGSYLNGERLTAHSPVEITSGSRLTLGDVELQVDLSKAKA